jgi:hypothetical protein
MNISNTHSGNKLSAKSLKESNNCKQSPFPWQTRRVQKSPFRAMKQAKKAEATFLAKRSIGFTATSSLKSMGRIPRSSGSYCLGAKYRETRRRGRGDTATMS